MIKFVNLGERGSLIDQFISELRDEEIQKDSLRFRKNLERTGEIMAYEISRELVFTKQSVKTPLGVANVPVLDRQPVIATVLRAGIPFHLGFLNFYDHADNAFVAGFRKYSGDTDFDVEIDYVTTPDLNGRDLIIVDPMLATGKSFVLAYHELKKYGEPEHIHFASIVSSKQGIDYLDKEMPDNKCTIWTAAVDKNLSPKSFIIPGLGDAGDLAYGPKL